MTRTKTKSVLSQSADGEFLRKGSRDRKDSKSKKSSEMPKSPLKFLDSNVDGICRKCTNGIDDIKEESIYCDRCNGCIHLKCSDMTPQEFQYMRKNEKKTKLIYHCPICVTELHDGNGEDDRIAKQNARLDSLAEFVQVIMCQNKELISLNKELLEAVKPENQPKKVEDDIQVQLTEVIQNQSEIEEKKKNIIVFNLPESEETESGKREQEEDLTKVKEILTFLDSRIDPNDIDIKKVERMGRRRGKDDKPRGIKVTLPSVDIKFQAIRNAKKLVDFKTPRIGISFDKTKKEVEEDKTLRQELSDMRTAEPEKDYVIFERKIVTRTEATRLREIRDAKRGNSGAPKY